jgi:NADP-dependent aldehyde dehydrogenase
MGQFCTNPGLLVAEQGEGLDRFLVALRREIQSVAPEDMLHSGIADAFRRKRTSILYLEGVQVEAVSAHAPSTDLQGIPTLCSTDARTFCTHPQLQEELFGPYSVLVRCQDPAEVLQVLDVLRGQLTCTLLATSTDLKRAPGLWDRCQELAGRVILHGVPTGVEVCLAMQHGGPYPACTDSRFTSVGADGIRRFARPLCFQDAPQELLPDALKDSNPLGIFRTVDNVLSRDPLIS